jgi:hypothetical protein
LKLRVIYPAQNTRWVVWVLQSRDILPLCFERGIHVAFAQLKIIAEMIIVLDYLQLENKTVDFDSQACVNAFGLPFYF